MRSDYVGRYFVDHFAHLRTLDHRGPFDRLLLLDREQLKGTPMTPKFLLGTKLNKSAVGIHVIDKMLSKAIGLGNGKLVKCILEQHFDEALNKGFESIYLHVSRPLFNQASPIMYGLASFHSDRLKAEEQEQSEYLEDRGLKQADAERSHAPLGTFLNPIPSSHDSNVVRVDFINRRKVA